jgi:HAD superfamily hydrolase (TIGR01662 family)
MKRFSYLLFDLGSTLIYYDGDLMQALHAGNSLLARALQQAGLPLDEAAFLAEFEKRMQAYFEQRDSEFIEYTTGYVLQALLKEWGYPPLDDALLRRVLRALYGASEERWLVEEDTHSTLQALKAQGYRLGMVSNASDDENVQVLVDLHNLRGYFDVVLTSAAQGIRKPNPRIFHAALSRWNAAPAQAAMIGDTLGADILGARNAGLFSIWITRRADAPANRDHLDTIQPDAVIATLAELPGLLSSLAGLPG